MKDNDVLQSISTAYDESKCLLDSALLIKKNELGKDVRVPTSFMNSSFGLWFYTEGLSLAKNSLFNSMVEQHQQVYGSYSKLFHAAKQGEDVAKSYIEFESLIESFHEKIDEVKQEFNSDLPEPEPEPEPKIESKKESPSQVVNIEREKPHEAIARVVQTNKANPSIDKGLSRTEALLEKLKNQKKETNSSSETKKTFSSKPKSDVTTRSTSIHDELQQENKNQFELKQELIEQELVQVKDRQRLFTKTINQLDYHHLLKEKEIKLEAKACKDKLSQSSILKKKKLSNLKEIERKRETTQQEFEEMELASIEFEKTNLHERTKEKEITDKIEQELKLIEKDHKKIINKQTKKKKVLEELRKRVQQAERELDSLLEDELEIDKEQALISNKKLKVQHEIEEKLVKQHQDREHYLELEELKFQSLQRLKKQYFSIQQEILHLEHEQKNIVHSGKESELVRLKEIKKLQEQRDLKQQMLDVLELEYQQKKLELKEITKEQDLILKDDSMDEMKELFAL